MPATAQSDKRNKAILSFINRSTARGTRVEDISASDVLASLKKSGIKIDSIAEIYHDRVWKARKGGKPTKAKRGLKKTGRRMGGRLDATALVQTKKFADKIGGLDTLREAVTTLEQLQ